MDCSKRGGLYDQQRDLSFFVASCAISTETKVTMQGLFAPYPLQCVSPNMRNQSYTQDLGFKNLYVDKHGRKPQWKMLARKQIVSGQRKSVLPKFAATRIISARFPDREPLISNGMDLQYQSLMIESNHVLKKHGFKNIELFIYL